MSNYDDIPTLRHEPEYLAGYGLQSPPFLTEHDDRFIYLDDERRQLLDMLQHLTRYSQLVLLVIGERGSGKSTLKQHFINQADDACLISEVAAHPMMDANELLAVIGQGFGLVDVTVSPTELHNTLYHYLARLQQQDRVPLLLVDDAHELSREALEALFYLADAEAGEGNLLRSVLFCEPAIEVMLGSTQIQSLNQPVTHRIQLHAFDEAQTAEYIRHRLAVAGLEGTSPFSPRDIHRIYQASGGLPERINQAAHQFLAEGRIDDLELGEEITVPMPGRDRSLDNRQIALAGVLLLVFLVVVVWWQLADPSAQTPQESAQAAAPFESHAAGELPVSEQVVAFDAGLTEAAPPQQAAEDLQSSPVESASTGKQAAAVLRIGSLTPDPVPARDTPQTLTLHGEGFDDTTRITVEWGNQRKTLLGSDVSRVDETRLAFRVNVGNRPETWLLIARNPQTGAQDSIQFTVQANDAAATDVADQVGVAQAAPAPTGGDIAWLQRQPAEHYTLQLLAGRQSQNLRVFIKQHNLDGQSVIVESRRDNEPWYAVVYGSYPDRALAQQAAGELPEGLEPWIRRIGDVQQSLVTAPGETITDKPVPRSQMPGDHAAWLWDQNPAHYTLQLIAGPHEQAVREFIEQHDLRGQALFYETRRNGKAWYVVVLGKYAGREAALDARQQLPAALQAHSPWPRPFSAIHADLSGH